MSGRLPPGEEQWGRLAALCAIPIGIAIWVILVMALGSR